MDTCKQAGSLSATPLVKRQGVPFETADPRKSLGLQNKLETCTDFYTHAHKDNAAFVRIPEHRQGLVLGAVELSRMHGPCPQAAHHV